MNRHYYRSFYRVVTKGSITYAGFKYSSKELRMIKDGISVHVTKFGDEKGVFDISKLLIDKCFWVHGENHESRT